MNEAGIDWSVGTWEGSRREQLRQWMKLSLEQKLAAMDDLGELARASLQERRRGGLPYFDPYTDELVRPHKTQ